MHIIGQIFLISIDLVLCNRHLLDLPRTTSPSFTVRTVIIYVTLMHSLGEFSTETIQCQNIINWLLSVGFFILFIDDPIGYRVRVK